MTSADILVDESPAVPRAPQPRILEILDEWTVIKAMADEYEQPSAVRCGLVTPYDERDASDPYWRQFVRRGEWS